MILLEELWLTSRWEYLALTNNFVSISCYDNTGGVLRCPRITSSIHSLACLARSTRAFFVGRTYCQAVYVQEEFSITGRVKWEKKYYEKKKFLINLWFPFRKVESSLFNTCSLSKNYIFAKTIFLLKNSVLKTLTIYLIWEMPTKNSDLESNIFKVLRWKTLIARWKAGLKRDMLMYSFFSGMP